MFLLFLTPQTQAFSTNVIEYIMYENMGNRQKKDVHKDDTYIYNMTQLSCVGTLWCHSIADEM